MTHQSDQGIKIIGQVFRIGATLSLWVLTMSQAHAVQYTSPNTTEMKSLPPYCEARSNEASPNRDMWKQTLGSSTFGSLLHYCNALNFMSHLYRTSDPERGTLLHFALDDLNYMLKSPDPRSPLTPEIYLSRAKALRLAHQDAGAISDYYKAIELNPKLAKAYSELADYFAGKALTAKALEIVTQGLRHLPANKTLERSYIQYGGKLPYPEPLVRPEEKPVAKPVVTTEKSEEIRPEPSSETLLPPSDVTAKVAPDSPAPTPKQDQSVIGTPNNPWCRFCTE